MSTKEAYEKKLEARLTEVKAEIDRLKARASDAEADARLELDERVGELESSRDEAQEKLGKVRSASEDAWEDLKRGADMAWESMDSAVKRATDRFR